MSRITHFNLYKCCACGQISGRAVWGTVGPRVPNDFGLSRSVCKTCPKCRKTNEIELYIFVGTSSLRDGYVVQWLLPDEIPNRPSRTGLANKLLDKIRPRQWRLEEFPLFDD
jgi:hypothetical protein